MITGETGTGKELLSRAVHAASPRSQRAFTPVNMDALAHTLFDDQFFGHARGAFTGADKEHAGYLESTDRGTLFLDEIGNLPLELQGRLLRVLQDGEFIKIGTNRPRKVDVRIIAATNKDLDAMMAKNLFRRDLYYRLSGGWVHLPPLRERKDDIPLLIESFLKEYCGPRPPEVSAETMRILLDYDYPGNVRELRSLIKAALNLAQGRRIDVACLPSHLPKLPAGRNSDASPASKSIATLAQLEKEHILKVYRLLKQNKAECARVLDIGINTLRRKLSFYGIL